MDGALTFPVLKELLLRGSASRGRGRPSRGRDVVIPDPNDPEQEDLARRRECKDLEAVDLTGCVSGVFVSALAQFVNTFLLDRSESDSSDSEDERERRRPRSRNLVQEESLTFPGMRRLGLRGVKSLQPHILEPLVLAFPHLTHLDLSCTRITPDGLAALGASPTVRLQSLALERCNWLTGESIRNFLVEAPATQDLRELSLYGDWTFPSPLSEEQLRDIVEFAPCFKNGQLVYLDLSSAPVTREILLDVCASQPRLRSLGLSYIRNLELGAVVEFLRTKANNVEILTLVSSTPELSVASSRQATIALHTQLIRPLCTPPFSFSLTSKPKTEDPPTRLRIIELAPRTGTSFFVNKGQRLTVIDPKGGQVSDLVAFSRHDTDEVISNGRTFDYADTIYLTTNHPLYSNRSNVMLKIADDTCGRHDFLLTPCSKDTFRIIYGDKEPHHGCFGNLSLALSKYDIAPDRIPCAFNCFMNVPVDGKTGKFTVEPPISKAGDHIDFVAEMDLIIAITA